MSHAPPEQILARRLRDVCRDRSSVKRVSEKLWLNTDDPVDEIPSASFEVELNSGVMLSVIVLQS